MIDYADIMTKAELLRKKLGEDSNSPVDIISLSQGINKLTLVFYPLGNNISGMCIKGRDGICTIAINSLMTMGRQSFSLAHELYHLFYDDNMKAICSKKIGSGDYTERKADVFAAYFLMPRAALAYKKEEMKPNKNDRLDLSDIVKIEQYFRVSHQAVLYQLLNCGYINHDDLESFLGISVRRQAESLGFSSDLYLPLSQNKQSRSYGYYIYQAEQLLNKGIISHGKYEELMLDAFRDDLVYGIDEGVDIID